MSEHNSVTAESLQADSSAEENGEKNLMSYFTSGDNASNDEHVNETNANNDVTPCPSPADPPSAQLDESEIATIVANDTHQETNVDLLAEAERQAAIAVALSQTSSTPSIVAGMARQLATNENKYGGTVVQLPPLPDETSSAHTLSTELANPVPLPNVIKPVRFDDVKIVFGRLWRDEVVKNRLLVGDHSVNKLEHESETKVEVELEPADDLDANQQKMNAEAVETEQTDHVMTGFAVSDTASSEVTEQSEKNTLSSKQDELLSTVPVADETASKISQIDLNKPEIENTIQTKHSSTSPQTTIPDSFLRFLLLLSRVPIIVEEGKQLHRSKQRSLQDSESNSFIAAKRALELYKLAKVSYDGIANGSKRDCGSEDDVTSAFFASCSGEDSSVKGVNGINCFANNKTSTEEAQSSPKIEKQQRRSLVDIGLPTASAMASASSMFSTVMSKVSKTDFTKKFHREDTHPPHSPQQHDDSITDYEITIDQEMLGLTVENILERTIIRTLLPDGAAKRSGAKIGSLIAKVGNVDTLNLTHFETIDELRQSQRPLKLTLRHISSEVLRCGREEMGRLIRGREEEDSTKSMASESDKPWRATCSGEESFESVLQERWLSQVQKPITNIAALPTSMMTRNEKIHRTGKDLIRILALLVVGMETELSAILDSSKSIHSSMSADIRTTHLKEAIEITSKTLLEYAKKHPGVDDKYKSDRSLSHLSSFYPLPPGRVGKKNPQSHLKGQKGKNKKALNDTPLLRIGDALQRATSFLAEPSSTTATALRWEIIDYLCAVLDLDSDNELAEKEAASSSEGGDSSQISDMGIAGSILKLIVVNCSTDNDSNSSTGTEGIVDRRLVPSRSQASPWSSNHNLHSGNPFLSVVHRLAASKSISARVSACSLGPVLWSHLDFPRQLQLRGIITRALHDIDLTVRKSIATVLHEIAELVFDRRSVPWLVLMCERSMTDPEPQLRAAAMTLTWHLAEHLPNSFLGDASKGSQSLRRLPPRTDPTFMDVYLLQCKLLPVASNLAEDKIPSVRLSVAAQCDRLCAAMGEHWFSVIIDLLQALLSDTDKRVRSEAVLCMPRLVESVVIGTSKGQTITVLESLLPQALRMQRDSSSEVRAALATATGDLLIFLVGAEDSINSHEVAPPSPGRGALRTPSQYKKYVDDTLIPILQKLLQDPNPEVTTASLRAVTNASRSSTGCSSARIPSTSHTFDSIDDDIQSISSHQSLQSHTSYDRKKPVFIPVLSEEQVLRLLPTLSNLATSREWRVRQSAVEIVPALLGCTFQHETRNEISKFCLKLTSDRVDAVRKTAAECLCLGGSSLARHGEDDGGAWITNIVVPHLKSCSQSEDSKQRLLCLKMIEIIITNGLCPVPQRTDNNVDISLNSSFDTASDNVGDTESAVKTILEIAASLSSDQVANIRLNVGRVFGSVILLLDSTDANFAVNILEKQLENERARSNGGDRDVIYFSQQAIMTSQLPRKASSYDIAA